MNERLILRGLIEVLRQGQSLLEALDAPTYAARVEGAFNASIGGHYRHCLDHFQSLLDALDGDEVNYDNRKRDARIENDREFALIETRRVFRGCDSIPPEWLRRTIMVRCKVSYLADESPTIPSTLGREIMYAVAHAVHHYALIGVMCGMLQIPLPSDFGVAPSTVKHREGAAPHGSRINGAESPALLVS